MNSTDLAIKVAVKDGTLNFKEYSDREGGTFIAIRDSEGSICTAFDMKEANFIVERAINGK